MAEGGMMRHHSPGSLALNPVSLRQISESGLQLGIDVLYQPQYSWIAEEFMASNKVGLEEGWAAYDTEDGNQYFYNSATDTTSWESPNKLYYEGVYNDCVQRDVAKGAHVLSVASRLAKHHEDKATLGRPRTSHGKSEKARKHAHLTTTAHEGYVSPNDVVKVCVCWSFFLLTSPPPLQS